MTLHYTSFDAGKRTDSCKRASLVQWLQELALSLIPLALAEAAEFSPSFSVSGRPEAPSVKRKRSEVLTGGS